MDERRSCLGSVYRVTADFLNARGLNESILPQLPAESRQLLERPPFSFGWQDYRPIEETEEALYARSPELPAELGRAAARYFSGNVIAPLIELAAVVSGRRPEALFGDLDRYFSTVVRGFAFRYEPSGARQGRVFSTISGGQVHAALFQQIKGNLHVVYELCGATGSVAEPLVLRSDAIGAEIALAVCWE